MSNRRPGYLIGVIGLAIAMTVPQLWSGGSWVAEAYQTGSFSAWYHGAPFISHRRQSGKLDDAAFWRNQLIYPDFCDQTAEKSPKVGRPEISTWSMDPETGKSADLGWNIHEPGRGYLHPIALENRLWLVVRLHSDDSTPRSTIRNGDAFEVINGELQPSNFIECPKKSRLGNTPTMFAVNKEPAGIETMDDGIIISTMNNGQWDSGRYVELPDMKRKWTFGKTQVTFNDHPQMTCLPHGIQRHTFLRVDGRTFYHEGLSLLPESATKIGVNRRTGFNGPQLDTSNEPVSALKPANTYDQIAGWSLVREAPERYSKWQTWHDPYGMLINSHPAVLMIDDADSGNPVGHFYRQDGMTWSEFATQSFPFGSCQFRVFSGQDAMKSYILATTSTGVGYLYAVDESGVRATTGAIPAYAHQLTLYRKYAFYLETIFTALGMSVVPAFGIWLLMWRSTNADYGFGLQRAKLASIGRRGLARFIDLALILISTLILGWVMSRGFDWDSLTEAIQLNVMHASALQVLFMMGVWNAVIVLAMIVTQGHWGVTPGKCCCGLRTLRTTLRPCGFARSLLREILLFVDTCNFVCWAPGVLSIALTDYRQRLGDRIGDTIVIEARSLTRSLENGVESMQQSTIQ